MNNFINWGHESPEQLEQRRQLEADLYELALVRTFEARQASQSSNATAAAASGGGGGSAEDPLAGTGSITFNGNDQYIEAPNSQVVTWLPGTGDFTIEWFMKQTSSPSHPRVFSLGVDTGATIGCSIEGGTCYIWPYGGALSGAMPNPYLNTWVHVAICRSGTTTKLFIDGVLKATKTGDSRNINNSINPGNSLYMGNDSPTPATNAWPGKLTNFRWTNSALYTGSSLTVPTSPLAKLAATKLLMLGGTLANPVRDSAGLNTLVNYGGVWSSDTPFV